MKKIKKIFLLCLLSVGMVPVTGAQPKPSLVAWGFRYPFEELCRVAGQNGITALEFVPADRWERAVRGGCTVVVSDGPDLGIERGFCDPRFHEELLKRYAEFIPRAAASGVRRIVCYSGIDPSSNRREAMDRCVDGLRPVIEVASRYGVTILMELVSSKRSEAPWWQHTYPYYAGDSAAWGAELVKRINSPNFKLLYDVWQMNDMGADVIGDIERYGRYIGHYHISGSERKAIDSNTNIDYKAILAAIVRSGYDGYIGIEMLIERGIPEAVYQATKLIRAEP